MKLYQIIVSLLCITCIADAQYEQKMSIVIEAGIFKTFGEKVGESGPMQMPNYELGPSANGGLQFRINERFSLSAEFGIKLTQRWSYYDGGDENYLYWSIHDSITNELIADGENYMDLVNYSIDLKPKYYLLPGKKLNPYVFAGVTVNMTRAYYEDQGWMELDKRNLLPSDDTGPENNILESNFGIGINPGVGVEYSLNQMINLYLNSGYYFIPMNKDNFKDSSRKENFHAFILQVGTRINFIKTKDL